MTRVSSRQVVMTSEASELPLPAEIQDALGEFLGVATEGPLALSVGLGLSVMHQLTEREVDNVVGPKGKHNRARWAIPATGRRRRRCLLLDVLLGSDDNPGPPGRPPRRDRSFRGSAAPLERRVEQRGRGRLSCIYAEALDPCDRLGVGHVERKVRPEVQSLGFDEVA